MQFDSYIVRCNYSEYAIMIMSVTGAAGKKFTLLKLFSEYMCSVKKQQQQKKRNTFLEFIHSLIYFSLFAVALFPAVSGCRAETVLEISPL